MPRRVRDLSRFHAKTLLIALNAYMEFMEYGSFEQTILELAKIHEPIGETLFIDREYRHTKLLQFTFWPYDDPSLMLTVNVRYKGMLEIGPESWTLHKIMFVAAGNTSYIEEYRYDDVGERIPQRVWGDIHTNPALLATYREKLKATQLKV